MDLTSSAFITVLTKVRGVIRVTKKRSVGEVTYESMLSILYQMMVRCLTIHSHEKLALREWNEKLFLFQSLSGGHNY